MDNLRANIGVARLDYWYVSRLALCFAALIFSFVPAARNIQLPILTIIGVVIAATYVQRPCSIPRASRKIFVISAALATWVLLSAFWSAHAQALQLGILYAVMWILFATLFDIFHHNPITIKIWLSGYLMMVIGMGIVFAVRLFLYDNERFQFGHILANPAATLFFPLLFLSIRGMAIPRRHRIIGLAGFAIAAVFIVITFSRGALLAAACGLLFYAVHSRAIISQRLAILQRLGLVVSVAAALILAAYGLATLTPQFTSRNLLRPSDYNIAERQTYAKIAWELHKERPIIGQGIGSYAVLGTMRQMNLSTGSINAHSSLLQFTAELGLVGLFLLAMLAYLVGQSLWRIKQSGLGVAIGASLIATIAHFAIDIHLEYPLLLVMLVSQVAIVTALSSATKT